MMKQDVEILESNLRESPYIRILSNHIENDDGGDDDDLGFEDYEEPDVGDMPQQGAYMGGNYQDQGYENTNQPIHGYGGTQASFGHQGQQQEFQRYTHSQNQGQQRQQVQSGFYQHGGEFQQQDTQHIKTQAGQGYQMYEKGVAQNQPYHASPHQSPQLGPQNLALGK